MKNKQKIIILGLDGATWTVLRPLIEKGKLPTFKKLMENGAYGTPLSCIPCRSCVAIPTFYTGVNPGKWGMFNFPCFDVDAVSYEKVKTRAQPVWDILGKYGYQSTILNLPTTYPPAQTSGVMISGFPPSEETEYTYPKDFKKRVQGFHSQRETFFALAYGRVTMERKTDRLNFLVKNAKERYGLIKNIIKDESFDFSIFWLDEVDSMQHVFWGDEGLLLTFFQEMDNILKDIVEQNPDANIMVMSDHGFAARPTHDFYPKAWLKKEGYLKLKGNILQRWLIQKINTIALGVHPRSRYKYIGWLYGIYKKIKKSKKVASPQPGWREISEGRPTSQVIGIDWEKTIATNHDFWGIRIIRENLDRDYEEVREEMIAKMKELKDETGQKIIKEVYKKEEIFRGQDFSKFPDIVYLPQSKFEATGFLPFCLTRSKPLPLKRGGDHLTIREGIIMAAGPDIKKAGDIGKINILDVVPTILHAFKIPVPEDMDGRALKEIFKSD